MFGYIPCTADRRSPFRVRSKQRSINAVMNCQSLCSRKPVFLPQAISNGVTYTHNLMWCPGSEVAFEIIDIPPRAPTVKNLLRIFTAGPWGHCRCQKLLYGNVSLENPACSQIENEIGGVKLAFFEYTDVGSHLGQNPLGLLP